MTVVCPACGNADSDPTEDDAGRGSCSRGHRWQRTEVPLLEGCSFCGKRPPDALHLRHGGSGVAICEHCVALLAHVNEAEGVVADRFYFGMPPETEMSSPVTNDDASEAR